MQGSSHVSLCHCLRTYLWWLWPWAWVPIAGPLWIHPCIWAKPRLPMATLGPWPSTVGTNSWLFLWDVGILRWTTLAPSCCLANVYENVPQFVTLFLSPPSFHPSCHPGVTLTLSSEGPPHLPHSCFCVHSCFPLQVSYIFNPVLASAPLRTQSNTMLSLKFKSYQADHCAVGLWGVTSQGLRHVPLVLIERKTKVSLAFCANLQPHFITQSVPSLTTGCVINHFWKKWNKTTQHENAAE